jgi:Tfp pilus assembly protein PilF
VPRAAEKEMERAEKARAKGDRDDYAAHLERAIEHMPRYTEALNNLGVLRLEQGREDEAALLLDRAIGSDPECAAALHNRGVLLALRKQFAGAEADVRHALSIDPQMPAARYLLGSLLQRRPEAAAEAVHYLTSAAAEFPQARMRAALILRNSNRPDEARAHVREYLKTGDQRYAVLASHWLRH